MALIDTIRLKSKGHLVIPADLREGFKEGEELVVIRDKNSLILKQTSSLSEKDQEDLEFAKRTEEAWKEIEAGRGITMEFDDFIEEMKKW